MVHAHVSPLELAHEEALRRRRQHRALQRLQAVSPADAPVRQMTGKC